jgi:hypothetical protein
VKACTARPLPWSTALSVVLFALCGFAGEVCVSLVAFANQSQAPAFAGASASPPCPEGVQGTSVSTLCVDGSYYIHWVLPGQTLTHSFSPTPASEDTLVSDPLPPFESPLSPPVPEEELSSSPVQVPPLSTDENRDHAHAAFQDGQKALEMTVWQQGTSIEQLLTSKLQHGWQLEQLEREVAKLKSDQLHLRDTIAAIYNDAEKRQAYSSFVKNVALASGVVFTLTLLGIVIYRMVGSRPPEPLPSPQTPCYGTKPRAPVPACQEGNPLPDIHMALHYLSTPKHEDRIVSASCPGLHVLVCADGASSYRGEGTERSGGGGEAAAIAAKVAITHLTDHLHPALGITELLAHLHDCFAKAHTALVHHNGAASIPGATTLLFAALWQAESGVWYWLYGNIGDGVLTLLHTTQLLSGWPLSTPLTLQAVQWHNNDHAARLRCLGLCALHRRSAPHPGRYAPHWLRWAFASGHRHKTR